MTSMRTHYLVLASCGVVIVLLSFGVWLAYVAQLHGLLPPLGLGLIFTLILTHDEWREAVKMHREKFKKPPFTTERG